MRCYSAQSREWGVPGVNHDEASSIDVGGHIIIYEEWALVGGKMRAATNGWQHHNLNLAQPDYEI